MLAIRPRTSPVDARVEVPGSKSMTNRALVVASLAETGVSRLYRPLEADDTAVMRSALRSYGVLIDDNDDPWLVLGTGGDLAEPEAVVDVGASGTTARFVTAIAGLVPGLSKIDGIPRMRERPIGALLDALGAMGVDASGAEGFPPVEVRGTGRLTGGRVTVDASVSSQFASAILMVAPLADERVEIELQGPVVSRSYLEGTVEMMRVFGAEVTVDGDRFVVEPTGYRKAHVAIEPDASAAVYPAVAAAITGGHVVIPGVPPQSVQPDLAILDVLAAMGCRVARTDAGVEVTGPEGGRLAPVDVDLTNAPDGSMAVAVAAMFADGETRIRGLSTLRVKETDRLAALETEIRRLGSEADVVDDSLVIRPRPLHGAEIQTYGDHRMAMSLALVGLRVEGVSVSDPTVVNKTWPEYFRMLEQL